MKRKKYDRAVRLARAKKKLRIHMIYSVAIIFVLFAINIMTDGIFWAQWPMLGIGISLLFHAISVMKKGYLEDYEERSIQKEMSKYKNNGSIDDDFEEHDEVLELDELPELRKEWKDSDFV